MSKSFFFISDQLNLWRKPTDNFDSYLFVNGQLNMTNRQLDVTNRRRSRVRYANDWWMRPVLYCLPVEAIEDRKKTPPKPFRWQLFCFVFIQVTCCRRHRGVYNASLWCSRLLCTPLAKSVHRDNENLNPLEFTFVLFCLLYLKKNQNLQLVLSNLISVNTCNFHLVFFVPQNKQKKT